MADRGCTHASSADEIVLSPSQLDQVLSGALPCAVCSYELRGLSIRGLCPECGTPIRATIRFLVDPRADEFKPLSSPRFTALALTFWSGGALIAAVAFWLVHVFAFLRLEMGVPIRTGVAEPIVLFGLGLSCVGSLGLVRPLRGLSLRTSILPLLGVLGYGLLIWAVVRMQAHDDASLIPYLDAPPDEWRTALRALSGVSVMAIILLLRPNARRLVERCLVLRTGRVDRQTLFALALAMGIGLVGDGLHLVSLLALDGSPSWLSWIGTSLIALSGLFIVAGLVHAQLDTWHIRKSLLAPSPRLDDLIDENDEPSDGSGE